MVAFLRFQCIQELTNVQSRVISQLKDLEATNQTKITCSLQHYGCMIDHGKHDYFKSCQQSEIQLQSRRKEPHDNSIQGSKSIKSLVRKLDCICHSGNTDPNIPPMYEP